MGFLYQLAYINKELNSWENIIIIFEVVNPLDGILKLHTLHQLPKNLTALKHNTRLLKLMKPCTQSCNNCNLAIMLCSDWSSFAEPAHTRGGGY